MRLTPHHLQIVNEIITNAIVDVRDLTDLIFTLLL